MIGDVIAMGEEHERDAPEILEAADQRTCESRRVHEHVPGFPRDEIARRINGSRLKDWWNPRPRVADLPPEEWSNNSIEGGIEPNLHVFQNWDPQYWQAIRQYILNLAEGGPTR
jgi:hypothetical protein